jgi:Heterokaryon incompatibility protein (HET)
MIRALTTDTYIATLQYSEDGCQNAYSWQNDCSTASPANIALARFWLRNCLENHRPCRNALPNEALPSRIINIKDPQRPFMEDGKRRSEPYVTLSYKWGNSARYFATSANLSLLQKAIARNELPKTFRDAIDISFSLGFEWLWIDALCILQDCQEDKKREIARMDHVYRASTLTVFASAADDADAGLSVDRDPRFVKPCLLNVRSTIESAQRVEQVYAHPFVKPPTDPPLFTRGWVLQEQVLSARRLLFGPEELRWECICCEAVENYPGISGRVDSMDQIDRKGTDQIPRLMRIWIQEKDLQSLSLKWAQTPFDCWRELVQDYSRRQLTFAADVLDAIAGLANAFRHTHGCTYVFGLWKEDLPMGLAWYARGNGKKKALTSCNPSTPKEGGDLPSWSWASQWGKTIWFHSRRFGPRSRFSPVEEEGILFEVPGDMRSRCQPGNLTRATNREAFTLTGQLKPATVGKPLRIGGDSEITDPVSDEVIGRITLDEAPGESPIHKVQCFLLWAATEEYNMWQLGCIALVPTDNESSDEFKRVGYVLVKQSKLDWFGTLEPSGDNPDKDDVWHYRKTGRREHTRTIHLV